MMYMEKDVYLNPSLFAAQKSKIQPKSLHRSSSIRLITRMDIKGPNLIKGVHLEGLRIIGDPQAYAKHYYESGADEIIYMDIVASLYGRNNLHDIVNYTAQNVFIPFTVGGGIRSVDDVNTMLLSGADKVAINTAAVQTPSLISQIAERFGSQCIVLSIEAKKKTDGKWEAYTDNGRERTGLNVLEWAHQGEELGAGEILLTSIDQEGTGKGFDIELCKSITSQLSIPVIISGGMGNSEHLKAAVTEGHVDAIAMADILHYDRMTLAEIREQAQKDNIMVRSV